MKFKIPRAIRRAMRLARAGKPRSSARAMQRAIGATMIKTTLSTLQAITPGKPTVARKHRKTPVKARKKAAPRAGAQVDRRPSAVVKQLRAARSSLPARLLLDRGPVPSRPPPIPRGAQYLDRTYRGRAGTRNFKLFLPARQSQGPKGLILMLHGCARSHGHHQGQAEGDAASRRLTPDLGRNEVATHQGAWPFSSMQVGCGATHGPAGVHQFIASYCGRD